LREVVFAQREAGTGLAAKDADIGHDRPTMKGRGLPA
jgi:hypothetical protein